MEARLAIRDHWGGSTGIRAWLPELETALAGIQARLDIALREAHQPSVAANTLIHMAPVKAVSGGRELSFPWDSVLQFIPGDQVAGRPFVPVGDQLVAVVPASGKAHEGVTFGIVVRTKSGQQIVVPVQSLEVQAIESVSSAIRTAA
jgi:hypothetical protein